MSLEEISHHESSKFDQIHFPSLEVCQNEVQQLGKELEQVQHELDLALPEKEVQNFLDSVYSYLSQNPLAATLLLDSLRKSDIFSDINSVGLETTLNAKKKHLSISLRGLLNRKTEPTAFIVDSSIKYDSNIPGYDAMYESGKIKSSSSNISVQDLLTSLVKDGSFPIGLRQVFHESVHRKQHQDLQKAHSIRTKGIPNSVLYEALARRAADYPNADFEEVPKELISELSYETKSGASSNYYISEAEGSNRDAIKQEWINAFTLIDVYQGLGLSIGEISTLFEELVKQKKSDTETKLKGLQSYIQKKTDDQIEKAGITTIDKKGLYMKTLQKKKHLQARLQQLSARKTLIDGFKSALKH